jgi:ribosomal protein S18 acetylase RimI-like enzyme
MYEMQNLTIKDLTAALHADSTAGDQERPAATRSEAPAPVPHPAPPYAPPPQPLENEPEIEIEEPEEHVEEEPIVVSLEYGQVKHTSALVEFLADANERQKAEGVWRPTLDPYRAQGVLANMMSAKCVVVVTMGSKIIGSLGFWPHKEEWATDDSWVLVEKWFYVHPEYRSDGIAERLFDQFLDEALSRNLPCVCGVWSGKDVAMKDKFLSRRGVKYVGGMFVGEPPGVQQRNHNHH